MNTPELVYSHDEEYFNDLSVEDAVEAVLNQGGISAGDIITIWAGTPNRPKASDYIPDVFDHLGERAYDDMSEFADGWLSGTTKKEEERLSELVAEAVDKWADECGKQPGFYKIYEVKEFKILIDDLEDNKFTVLENPFASYGEST